MQLLGKESSESIKRGSQNSDSIASEWFKTAYQLASRGKLSEAEVAIKKALSLEEHYAIAWIVLAAILLASGRETDAELAGKKALEHCRKLNITWPKLRSLILSGVIRKGADWKSPRRIIIEGIPNNEWGKVLSILNEENGGDFADLTKYGTEENNEYKIVDEAITDIDVTEDKSIRNIESTQLDGSKRITSPKQKAIASTETPIPQTSSPRDTASARDWFRAAETHLRKKSYDEAERAFRKGLQFNPLSNEGWLRLGSLLILKQEYIEAEEALLKATRQDPGNDKAWYLYGLCLQELQKWKEAVVPLKNAININENQEEYWMKLGLSQYNLGEYKESSKCFLQTLRINPNHRDAMFHLAHCMELRGNRNHAFSLYNQLLKSGEQRPEVLDKMVKAFDRLGAPDRAREARRKAVISRRREQTTN